MHHQVTKAHQGKPFAVEQYLIVAGIDLGGRLFDVLAIEGHFSVFKRTFLPNCESAVWFHLKKRSSRIIARLLAVT